MGQSRIRGHQILTPLMKSFLLLRPMTSVQNFMKSDCGADDGQADQKRVIL